MTVVLTGQRLALQKVMQATLADESAKHDWTYVFARPTPVPVSWSPGQLVRGDCSKGVQFLCRWAKAPDPMENNWDIWGNSSTIWLRLEHVATAAELEVGDIVLFGVNGSEHAAMVLEAGPDPLLWSFGHQGAPDSYRLSQDRRVRTFCKLPIVPRPPTPKEKLQALTGYYSWVAWRQGEGPWKHYAPATKAVRPNVPKLISPLWWKRYAQFLLNRKKGS